MSLVPGPNYIRESGQSSSKQLCEVPVHALFMRELSP